MTKLAKSALLAAIFALTIASAAAQTLTGTVTNGTTNKPAAGDEVILINLANGMDVAGSTKADTAGKFSFKLKDARARTSSAPSIRESPITRWPLPASTRST